MPLPPVERQNLAQTAREVFRFLERIRGNAVDGFNAAFSFDQPFQALVTGLAHAAEVAHEDHDAKEEEALLGLRAALLSLCDTDAVTGGNCFQLQRRDAVRFDEAVRTAREKARNLSLLDLSVNLRQTKPSEVGSAEEKANTTSGSTQEVRSGPEDAEPASMPRPDTATEPEPHLPPRHARAASLLKAALEEKPELNGMTDEEVYFYIRENTVDQGEHLPDKETFLRYLRAVRKHMGKKKNFPVRGRTSRSARPEDEQ
jgi:hypothetical protein